MTCQGCADSINNALSSKGFTITSSVNFGKSELTLESNKDITLSEINSVIKELGNYKIINIDSSLVDNFIEFIISKKTLLVALLIVLLSSILIQGPS